MTKRAVNTAAELDNFLGAKRALVEAMVRDFEAGVPATNIALAASGAFGRDQVKQFLNAIALHNSARKALEEAGLAPVVDTSVTGIDAPREARLFLSANPAETPSYATLPQRIRDVLRDFLITLDLPKGEHDEVTEDLINSLLLDGEPIRLIKLEPRA
ncbi:hypothetical protein [Amycolatopsis sp. lyj-112]|uniref:hypothetical protein n=1 Tax=Amycolatopsis sp. lyj-112 TaxID=2789288 RepID=UPI00397DC372